MQPRTYLLFVAIFTFIVFASAAQDETAPCDQSVYNAAAESLDGFTARLRNESEDHTAVLMELSTFAATQNAACSGLNFSSETDGQNPLIGPIEIPAGLYRVTFTTSGRGLIDLAAIDGECEAERGGNMFAALDGEALEGIEGLVTSEGCEALITFDRMSEDWTLTFEKIR